MISVLYADDEFGTSSWNQAVSKIIGVHEKLDKELLVNNYFLQHSEGRQNALWAYYSVVCSMVFEKLVIPLRSSTTSQGVTGPSEFQSFVLVWRQKWYEFLRTACRDPSRKLMPCMVADFVAHERSASTWIQMRGVVNERDGEFTTRFQSGRT